MKECVTFSGILEVLACMIVMVEPCAALSREYNQILLPGGIIEGWHQAEENYYKFERRLIIGRDHPYQRQSSMRLFWPEGKSTYTARSRITFFKCINQTPNTAKTLMHVIHGGMGTPELELGITYTPVRSMLINTMIITCDIYTTDGDIVGNEEPLLWNPFDIRKINNPPGTEDTKLRIPTIYPTDEVRVESSFGGIHFKKIISSVDAKPTTEITISFQRNMKATNVESEKPVWQIKKGDSTTQRTTKRINNGKKLSKIGKRPEVKTIKFYTNVTNKIKHKITSQITETTQKADGIVLPVQGMDQRINTKSLKTNEPRLKTSSKDSKNKEINKISSNREKTSKKRKQTTLTVTSPTTVALTSQKSTMSLRIRNGSSNVEVQSLKTEKGIEIPREETGLETNKDKKIKKTGLSRKQTHPRTGKITSKVPSPKTVELSSTLSVTIPMTNKITSHTEGKGSKIEGAIHELYEEISPRANKTNLYIKGASVKTNNRDLQDKKGDGSKTEETKAKLTKHSTYNLILKIMPTGLKKKIGLAKITYG